MGKLCYFKMLKTLKATLKRERGFTLIELLAVMAIVATLAGIVTTSVSGTGETSRDAAARQDASSVHTSAGDYFSDQTGAQVLTPLTVEVVTKINGETHADLGAETTQVISSRWPETFITEELALESDPITTPYAVEFPTSLISSSSVIRDVIISDKEGFTISHLDLLTRYTAIDFVKLVGDPNDRDNFPGGYTAKPPDSSGQTQTALGETFRNYLWLFKKSTSAGGAGEDDSRVVALVKLVSIQVVDESGVDMVDLRFVQI